MEATIQAPSVTVVNELPIRVREAAVFLGVSPQTVYLWVER
jgi:transposase